MTEANSAPAIDAPNDGPAVWTGGAIPAEQPVVIAVDAMGGDFAPAEVVRGAALYLHRHAGVDNARIQLVGIEERIHAELQAIQTAKPVSIRPLAGTVWRSCQRRRSSVWTNTRPKRSATSPNRRSP